MNGMLSWKAVNSIMNPNRNQNLLDLLANKRNAVNKGQRDLFIRSGDRVGEIGLYTASAPKMARKVSDAVLDMINFEYMACETDTGFIFGGVEYYNEDIPSISLDKCLKAEAENNAIVFHTGKYYQFTDEAGKTHILTCSYGRMMQPNSDTSRGVVDDKSFEIGRFWNMLSTNGTFLGLYYSQETERKLLNDAGIKDGFFSVQVGDNKQDYFYSNGNAGTAVLKSRYDNTYQMYMTQNEIIFRDYEPGSVFRVGGEEYVLSEDRKLDIPYGADIYDVKWPPRKQA